jgi:hypothetical protein
MRITVGSYGYAISWAVEPGIDLSSASVAESWLHGPGQQQPVDVSLNAESRVLTYTVRERDVRTPGYHTVRVTLATTATRVDVSTHEFLAYGQDFAASMSSFAR